MRSIIECIGVFQGAFIGDGCYFLKAIFLEKAIEEFSEFFM